MSLRNKNFFVRTVLCHDYGSFLVLFGQKIKGPQMRIKQTLRLFQNLVRIGMNKIHHLKSQSYPGSSLRLTRLGLGLADCLKNLA